MGLIKKSYEISVNPKIKMLLYGQPGMGKTTMALSAPKPLLLDFDGGIHRVNIAHRTDTVQITSYDEALEVLRKEDLTPYESIVIDTGGKMLDFMAAYIIKRNSKMGKANGALTLQGYGERKQEFIAFCKLVAGLNKHLVFVAHRETRTEGDDTRYVPQFGGSSYDALVTELDLVGYIEANGTARTITFNGTSRNDGKNTCNLPGMINIPTIVDKDGNGIPNDFLTKFVINPYIARLQHDKEVNAEYANVIAEIDTAVKAVETLEDANGLIDGIDDFKHVGTSKMYAGLELNKKAKALGFTFDKKTKHYAAV